jgi:DNA (cytosine-5)-methyltransferase 1
MFKLKYRRCNHVNILKRKRKNKLFDNLNFESLEPEHVFDRVREIMACEDRFSVKSPPTFVDLFAGCGGLSLGFMQAGWKGLLAIEKSPDAFNTLWSNLGLQKENYGRGNIDPNVKYRWPSGLGTPRAHKIEDFLNNHNYRDRLKELAVDLLAGGPPCQGFSSAGRRVQGDKRNRLYRQYLRFVKLVKPKVLLIENVKGISMPFTKDGNQRSSEITYASRIKSDIDSLGYEAKWFDVQAWMYGVPQRRPRYILLGVNRDVLGNTRAVQLINDFGVGLISSSRREAFLVDELGLLAKNVDTPVSVRQAIGDLSSEKNDPQEVYDPYECDFTPGKYKGPYKGYMQLSYRYKLVGKPVLYQKLMRDGLNDGKVNGRRLAMHTAEVRKRFEIIHQLANAGVVRKGKNLTKDDKRKISSALGNGKEIKKYANVILDEKQPSHTLTTLPDDLLHYSEPRILTVREFARLQSFPDWFAFMGKYTTGGNRLSIGFKN